RPATTGTTRSATSMRSSWAMRTSARCSSSTRGACIRGSMLVCAQRRHNDGLGDEDDLDSLSRPACSVRRLDAESPPGAGVVSTHLAALEAAPEEGAEDACAGDVQRSVRADHTRLMRGGGADDHVDHRERERQGREPDPAVAERQLPDISPRQRTQRLQVQQEANRPDHCSRRPEDDGAQLLAPDTEHDECADQGEQVKMDQRDVDHLVEGPARPRIARVELQHRVEVTGRADDVTARAARDCEVQLCRLARRVDFECTLVPTPRTSCVAATQVDVAGGDVADLAVRSSSIALLAARIALRYWNDPPFIASARVAFA